jgi:16S rRNA (uracil1498-N3)-methyltransferase
VRIPRIVVPELPHSPGPFTLEGDEAIHLIRVLRVRKGAHVEAFDGRGRAARLEVIAVARRSLDLVYESTLPAGPRLGFELSVALSFPKGKRAHRVVEALTELGVDTLVPLALERGQQGSVPAAEQVERWAVEAAKQCGRNQLPRLGEVADLAALRALASSDSLCLLPDTRDARPLREVAGDAAPPRVLVVIGPEGGFTDAERAALGEAGFLAASLGPSVLRIETAAQGVVAALLALWGV